MTGTDPIKFVETLSAAAIAERLEQLAREDSALRVLLRAARARERVDRRRQSTTPKPEVARG
jgi:hypothetical protein